MDGTAWGTWIVRHNPSLVAAAWLLMILCLVLFFHRQEAEQTAQQEYIKALEGIVGKCTNQGDNPIQIGNELYMCGAARTGIKVKT